VKCQAASFFQFLFSAFLFSSAGLSFGEELLRDPEFTQGLEVISPERDPFTDRAPIEGIIFGPADGPRPAWQLQQWTNVQSILEGKSFSLPEGGTRWENRIELKDKPWLLKALSRTAAENETVNIMMELNGYAQYAITPDLGAVQKPEYIENLEDNWPHLLVVQNFPDLRVGDYQELNFALQAKLLFDEQNIQDGHIPTYHAGRFVASFIVQNTFSGNFFWLVLPLYDDRMAVSPFGCKKCIAEESCRAVYTLDEPGEWQCPFDGGLWRKEMAKRSTFKMMFRVGSRAFMRGSMSDGDWHNIKVDLIPLIEEAVQAARQQIKPQGFSESLKYYRISTFSLGWEVNGFNHVALAFKNVSLSGQKDRTSKH